MAPDCPKPCKAIIVPSSLGLEGFTPSTAFLRSAINVSTTGTVRIYGTVM